MNQLLRLLETNSEASLHLMLPSGEFVPNHFHITEVGRVQKTFIDCGGTRREAVSCLLQAWTAHDLEHRLTARKLSKILTLAETVLGSYDLPVEVEYGADVASQYVVADVEATPRGLLFVLAGKQTQCLASDKCGIGTCNTSGCC
ncbi:MAG: DUF6428 family protein [Pirellulaceae bacterium]